MTRIEFVTQQSAEVEKKSHGACTYFRTVKKPPTRQAHAKTQGVNHPIFHHGSNNDKMALYQALRSLYGSEKYSDLTVVCGTDQNARTFKLHRAVVCPQSDFFDKACSGGFLVCLSPHSVSYHWQQLTVCLLLLLLGVLHRQDRTSRRRPRYL